MNFSEEFFATARHDLATVLLDRSLIWGQTSAFVTPQGWLFQPRWKRFRHGLLRSRGLIAVVWLGEHAFESEAAAGAFTSLQIINREAAVNKDHFFGIDCDSAETPSAKADAVRSAVLVQLQQSRQRLNPDARVLVTTSEIPTLGEVADSYQGIKTCDNPRFMRAFWETAVQLPGWRFIQSAPDKTDLYRG
ncbi:MAG: hypothetical protein PHQ28_16215, partial [Mycobacterium sp.]|nr:hypothetical protein [Mycobacterium sp.]